LIGLAGANQSGTDPGVQDLQLWTEEIRSKSATRRASSGLLIILVYPGELIMDGDLVARWHYRAVAMVPFLYNVYKLLIGLAGATQLETDPSVCDGPLGTHRQDSAFATVSFGDIVYDMLIGLAGAKLKTDPSVKDLKLLTVESRSKSTTLGAAAGLMIILGYPGELIIELIMGGRWGTRRQYRAFAMVPFVYIVYEFLIGHARLRWRRTRACRTCSSRRRRAGARTPLSEPLQVF
jgi:hypothetical protein